MADEQVKAPLTEAAALTSIYEWSKTRPGWVRDGLRRLVVGNGDLTGQDIDDLFKICVGEQKVFVPITEKHISPEKVKGEPVSLTAVNSTVGVNALADDQHLSFVPTGMTVVYGDNASGKSGYVRVLKHACRTRDKGTRILQDIHTNDKVDQSAEIHFQRGDKAINTIWKPGEDSLPDLASVSIFDAKSAATHLSNEHEVAYTPFPMKVLHALGMACDDIRKKIDAKIEALEAQTPEAIKEPNLSAETPAGAYLLHLSAASDSYALDQLCTFSDEEKKRHEALKADLVGDPKKAAARLQSLVARLNGQTEQIQDLIEAADDEAFTLVSNAVKRRDDTAEASKIASGALFDDAPLPEIGGDLWKSLWEAAREYSNAQAMPEKLFPHVALNEDICVLCLQPLSDEAVARWKTFEGFVKGKTKAEEESAASAYKELIDSRLAAGIPLSQIRPLWTSMEQELRNVQLSETLRASILTGLWRLRALVAEKTAPVPQSAFPKDDLDAQLDEITARINALNADADSDAHQAIVAELRELEDRAQLQGIAADVKLEIERRKKIEVLRKANKTAAKNTVTAKNKELSDQLVTETLKDRFKREIEKLDVLSMPVELRKEKDRNAQSFFKVAITGKKNAPIGEVLSEGEHRCVALAAFLAELVTSREYSGIVFDDPMSSLDHLHRSNVAKRLVEEAQHRQVVVFTHDLTFLFELDRKAKDQEIEPSYQTVRRKSAVPGHIEEDLPFKAKTAQKMESSLRSYLKSLKGSFDNKKEPERTTVAKGVIAQIREAWEQGIADFINPVLARFDRAVKPGSLFKLLVLDDNDVKYVQEARSRLSEDIHASPETINPAEITHAELVEELNKFKAWFDGVMAKQKAAKVPT